jgi:hypothetical protein
LLLPPEFHPSKVEEKALQLHGLGPQGGAPAQLHVHPGPQHRQGERLCDIVVRAGFQPGDDVRFQVVGGEQDHRDAAGQPGLPQQVQTAAVGQIHV